MKTQQIQLKNSKLKENKHLSPSTTKKNKQTNLRAKIKRFRWFLNVCKNEVSVVISLKLCSILLLKGSPSKVSRGEQLCCHFCPGHDVRVRF